MEGTPDALGWLLHLREAKSFDIPRSRSRVFHYAKAAFLEVATPFFAVNGMYSALLDDSRG